MLSADITVDTVTTGPDRYAMSRESPLTDEHAKLASLLEEKIQAAKVEHGFGNLQSWQGNTGDAMTLHGDDFWSRRWNATWLRC